MAQLAPLPSRKPPVLRFGDSCFIYFFVCCLRVKFFSFLRFLFVFVGFLFVSCSEPQRQAVDFPLGFSREQLKAKLDENFIFSSRCDIIVDKVYLIPNKRWLTTVFIPFFQEYKSKNKIDYKAGRADCDDFAMHARLCAQSLGVDGQSVAFGLYFYRTAELSGHAINLVPVLNEDKIELLFFEPQLNKQIELSLDQKANCVFWYF